MRAQMSCIFTLSCRKVKSWKKNDGEKQWVHNDKRQEATENCFERDPSPLSSPRQQSFYHKGDTTRFSAILYLEEVQGAATIIQSKVLLTKRQIKVKAIQCNEG